MAKQRKKSSSKNVHAAALIKKDRDFHLKRLIAVAIGGVLIWALYTFVIRDLMPNEQFDSGVVYFLALCMVFFIGEAGNKFARYNAEYRKAKNEWGVTDEEVTEHMKKM